MISGKDVVLISISATLGALSSVIAFRSICSNPKRPRPRCFSPSENGYLEGSQAPNPFDPSKRKGYLSWDDYFMAIAFLSAKRSKDPNTQVGACLVSQTGIILGIGYNGFPRGCSDDKLPWAKMSVNGDHLETKYPYVVHAEVNAILNTNHASAAGQRLYVTMFPCNECAKVIIQSGVSEVIYFIEKRLNNSEAMYAASHKLLSLAGVKVRKHHPQMTEITLKLE
ncbi:deoxycytidylate deaminase [Phalaenopsis equestris]|uniref:deoxycytidylate deaminase n=1 Tax=Phalaenopsis equestris TaxID=78828 RepID=UPI0009E64593|nr:deoxycytidylate deaminase [Phalaenopsis equestris]